MLKTAERGQGLVHCFVSHSPSRLPTTLRCKIRGGSIKWQLPLFLKSRHVSLIVCSSSQTSASSVLSNVPLDIPDSFEKRLIDIWVMTS